MIPLKVHHFDKRTVWSVIYFWSMPILTLSTFANFGDHPLAIFSLFQPGRGADIGISHIGISQSTFKPFHRDWALNTYIRRCYLEHHPQNSRLHFCTTYFLPILFKQFFKVRELEIKKLGKCTLSYQFFVSPTLCQFHLSNFVNKYKY